MTVGKLKQLIARYNDDAQVEIFDTTHEISYYRSLRLNESMSNCQHKFVLDFEGSPNLLRVETDLRL